MSKPIIAAIMAGGEWKGDAPSGQSRWRSLVDLNGRPMIEYVIKALRGSTQVSQIVIIGPRDVTAVAVDIPRLNSAPSFTENVLAACRYVAGKGNLLLVGSDIPLVTAEVIDSFIDECDTESYRLFYPVISKDAALAQYNDLGRTFLRLADDTYTGGNVIFTEPEALLSVAPRIEAMYEARKNPLKIARLLGAELLFRTFLTAGVGLPLLTSTSAARIISKKIGIPVCAIPTNDAQLGADLDSAGDITRFEAHLRMAKDLWR